MARQLTNFELVVIAMTERREFNNNKQWNRGYSTDGEKLWLNGHLLAQWWNGAIRMFINIPAFHQYLVAQAVLRVRAAFKRLGFLAERDEVICKEHEDCRLWVNLGEACAQNRMTMGEWLPPFPLPYFEEQARIHG